MKRGRSLKWGNVRIVEPKEYQLNVLFGLFEKVLEVESHLPIGRQRSPKGIIPKLIRSPGVEMRFNKETKKESWLRLGIIPNRSNLYVRPSFVISPFCFS